MLKASKTFNSEARQNIGVIRERYCKCIDDGVHNQSLPGRCRGYYKKLPINNLPILFCSLDSLRRYQEMYESKYQNMKIKYKSSTTKWNKKSKLLESRRTTNDPKNFKNLDPKIHLSTRTIKIKKKEKDYIIIENLSGELMKYSNNMDGIENYLRDNDIPEGHLESKLRKYWGTWRVTNAIKNRNVVRIGKRGDYRLKYNFEKSKADYKSLIIKD